VWKNGGIESLKVTNKTGMGVRAFFQFGAASFIATTLVLLPLADAESLFFAAPLIVAFLSMDGHIIDRLFVIPEAWRQGWGSRLIECAKKESPERLELYTHQENHAAWALYEEHGFQAVEFGMSPPPESAPDVRYVWERPILAED